MKHLLLLFLLASCGGMPLLAEGVYAVELIELEGTCEWPNGNTGKFQWDIVRIDNEYGIENIGNHETIACSEEGNRIVCYKEKEVWVDDRCLYQVFQSVRLNPEEESFKGTLDLEFISCKNVYCHQLSRIEGHLQYRAPTYNTN